MLKDDITKFMQVTKMFDDTDAAFKRQHKQYLEELYGPNELTDSIYKKSLVGMLDGIGDASFVALTLSKLAKEENDIEVDLHSLHNLLYSITNYFNISSNTIKECTAEVARSNLSKFDTTIEAGRISLQAYTDKRILADLLYNEEADLYYLLSATDQTDQHGKTIHKGKILKSSKFSEPNFTDIVEANPYLLTIFEEPL